MAKHESYRESRARYRAVNDVVLAKARYCAITAPNYEIERAKLERMGIQPKLVAAHVRYMKRRHKQNLAENYAARKRKSSVAQEPQTED